MTERSETWTQAEPLKNLGCPWCEDGGPRWVSSNPQTNPLHITPYTPEKWWEPSGRVKCCVPDCCVPEHKTEGGHT